MDLVVDGVIFGLQKAGGISRVVADLLLKLEESSFKTALLVPTNQNIEWKTIAPLLKKIRVIKRRRFRWGKTSPLLDSFYLTTLLARLRPRIWHATYYTSFPLGKVHRMLSYHDMIPEQTGEVNRYDQVRKYEMLKKADTIFAPSHSACQDLKNYWPEIDRVTVIPHGLRPLQTAPIHWPRPYLVYVGKRGGYKSFLPAVQAVLADPRFAHLDIVAIGGEESREFNHPRLYYRGTLPFAQVLGWLKQAEALLFPSQYEGFGLPVLEAFALGTPVLARHTSSIPEITGGDYPLVQGDQYGSTLSQLLRERERWVNHGKQRASLFTQERIWKEYQSSYTKPCIAAASEISLS